MFNRVGDGVVGAPIITSLHSHYVTLFKSGLRKGIEHISDHERLITPKYFEIYFDKRTVCITRTSIL